MPDLSKGRVLASVAVCFCCSGFLGGLAGLMGPPLMLFVALNERAYIISCSDKVTKPKLAFTRYCNAHYLWCMA